jgi:phospholipase C
MTRRRIWTSTSTWLALAGMFGNTVAMAEPALTAATSANTAGAAIATDPDAETRLTPDGKLNLMRDKIKYVFVLFQENRAFDHYFGTYPGANGLQSTFAGAVTSLPANATPSWNQTIETIDGRFTQLHPFLVPRTVRTTAGNATTVQLYPESIYSVDHSHYGMATSMHFDAATLHHSANDAYALDNEGLAYLTDAAGLPGATPGVTVVAKGGSIHIPPNDTPAPARLKLYQKQEGEVAIAHVDCDTIPFLWHYADLGTLFDNLHQTTIGPSTPNAIALISAQTGETQWALHPRTTGLNAGVGAPYAVPNETDSAPYAGSPADIASFGASVPALPPFGPDEAGFAACATANADHTYNNTACPAARGPAAGIRTASAIVPLQGPRRAEAAGQMTLTYAALPLSFMGSRALDIVAQDYHPATDLADIGQDIYRVQAQNPPVNWGWYQQGYGPEPFDGKAGVNTFPPATPHSSYIVHHNGPQYFGYIGDNPAELAHLHGLQQFYTDIANLALPAAGGVFYVRGGYFNNDGLLPADPNPDVQATFAGNDDHGSYSDSQISEALVADSINAIAHSPYWPRSAIIITYDESDGFYDHAPARIRTLDPTGTPEAGGPRIPTIVISPYAASHVVSHVYSEHGSVVKLIEELFRLVPLYQLPNEAFGRRQGETALGQRSLGPNDGDGVGDMLEAFDNDRLLGTKKPIAPETVALPASTVTTLPHFNGAGCAALNITPTDYPDGYGVGQENDPPPADFNPRPTISIGTATGAQAAGVSYPDNIPTSGAWTP